MKAPNAPKMKVRRLATDRSLMIVDDTNVPGVKHQQMDFIMTGRHMRIWIIRPEFTPSVSVLLGAAMDSSE